MTSHENANRRLEADFARLYESGRRAGALEAVQHARRLMVEIAFKHLDRHLKNRAEYRAVESLRDDIQESLRYYSAELRREDATARRATDKTVDALASLRGEARH